MPVFHIPVLLLPFAEPHIPNTMAKQMLVVLVLLSVLYGSCFALKEEDCEGE